MALQITNRLLVEEALRRGWDAREIDGESGLIGITPKGGEEFIQKSSLHPGTTAFGKFVADNKRVFQLLAEREGLPVPWAVSSTNWDSVKDRVHAGTSVVVKPVDGGHGNGITAGVDSQEKFRIAVDTALGFSDQVIVQEQVYGNDYRVLVIGDEVVAASHRKPAFVTGDGVHTVAELIDIENTTNPDRAPDYQKKMNLINKEKAVELLGEKVTAVPESGVEVTVTNIPNIGQGGVSIDVTNDVSDYLRETAVAAAKVGGLRVAGVDFMCEDVSETDPANVALIEVNATPSFGLHENPIIGEPIAVSSIFLDEITR